MTDTNYTYGDEVVEFFKHDEGELSELIERQIAQYSTKSEGLYFKEIAENIDWGCKKQLNTALLELQEAGRKG